MKKLKDITVVKKDKGGKVISTEEVQMVDMISCNKCGRVVWDTSQDDSLPLDRDEWIEINQRWGFYSEWDLEEHEFHLCQKCYKGLLSSFKHKDISRMYLPFQN